MTDRPSDELSWALSALFLDVFRLNGRLLVAGDRLVAPLGLTSARWQVMGAIALNTQPQPVAHLARQMGLSRQGVQRVVNELAAEGLVAFRENPHHRRAKLAVLTEKGRERFLAAQRLQRPWVDGLAEGLDRQRLSAAAEILQALIARLEDEPEPG